MSPIKHRINYACYQVYDLKNITQMKKSQKPYNVWFINVQCEQKANLQTEKGVVVAHSQESGKNHWKHRKTSVMVM